MTDILDLSEDQVFRIFSRAQQVLDVRIDEATGKIFTLEVSVSGTVFIVEYSPATGQDFLYPLSAAKPGSAPLAEAIAASELPVNDIGGVRGFDDSGALIFSLSGFEPLTFTELGALEDDAAFDAYFFGDDDRVTGGDPAQRLSGFAGADRIDGAGGNDTLEGGTGADTLVGGLGRDSLLGGAGRDSLFGDAGNDRALGGGGADALVGGDGRDTLPGTTGSPGRDVRTGGAGRDTFVYQTRPAANGQESGLGAARRDTITDFRPGQDRIDVSFISIEPFEFLGDGALSGGPQIRVRGLGANTLVEISTDDDAQAELSMLLTGRLTLGAGDFVV